MKSSFLSWKPSYIVSEWAWVWQSSWCHLRKCLCHISKVHYFDFLVSCMYTFNPLSLSLDWMTTLVATTYKNMEAGSPTKLPTWWWSRGQRGDHLFLFSDRILFCTIHTRQIKLSWKSRNGNKKFQTTMSKALVEFW